MLTSQNGYSANDRSVIATYTVVGTTLRIPLRKGDVSVVLLDFLARYHRDVESLYHSPQDLWGYAARTIRGSSTTLSNHASGTAADHRAVDHPLGKVGTFTAAEVHAIDRLLAFYEGVLRHGKNYSGRKDEMHVEINASATAVRRIADKIRGGAKPTIPVMPGGPRMELNDLLPDRYAEGLPRMSVANTLAWSAAHAAHARGHAARAQAAAEGAMAALARVEQKLDALIARPGGQLDPAALRAGVTAALGGGLTISGTAVPANTAPKG